MSLYQPEQRAVSSRAVPVRLLERRDRSTLLPIATQTSLASNGMKTSKLRRSSREKTPYEAKGKTLLSASAAPPSMPEAPRLAVEDARVLVQRVDTWEKRVEKCRLETRKGKDRNDVTIARSTLRCTCVELIYAYPKTAKKLNINERVWKSWYYEIQEQSPLVLASCSAFYSNLIAQLQCSLRRPNRCHDRLNGLKHSLQMSLIARGDVARYEQSQRGYRDWTAARQYYHQALEVAPANGKVYNQLGLLAVLEGRAVDGAYYYARSLACEHSFSTSDNLLHALQRGKTTGRHFQHDEMTCEAMETYSTRMLSCLHTILTAEGSKSEWRQAMGDMEATLRHLLEVCGQQDEQVPIDGPLLESLSLTLIRVICLIIVVTHGTQCVVGEPTSHRMFDEDFDNWTDNEATTRSLAVGDTTMTCLLSKLSVVLATSAESTRTKYLANALLPAVNLYLDWLHFHETLLQQLNASASTLQDDCAELSRILSCNGFVERSLCCARKRDESLSSVALPEDHEMDGFLPYVKALQARFPTGLTPKKKSLRPLTEEERLVLRATRFMTSSERYVLPGKLSVASPIKRVSESSILNDSLTEYPRASREAAEVDPLAIRPAFASRLCTLCSNTSTFANGLCEFCGYEDDVDSVSNDENDGVIRWIQEYDVAYSSNESTFARNLASCGFSPKRSCSASSASSTSASSPSKSPLKTFDVDFKTIMAIGAGHADFQDSLVAGTSQQRLVVIDASNVAMRHGKGKIFSCVGIQLAIEYFQKLGHRVVAFIPDYMLQSDEERAERQEQGERFPVAKMPDDVALLERLVHKNVLIPTPSQDYDDSYSIQYAGLHNGYIVTNDLFRDHIVNMVGPRERKVAMRAWLRVHQISYSWVRNEFLPNPNFRFLAADKAS